MARKRTVGSLITRAQQRCDMENSELLSTAEWKGLLDTAHGEFYSLVVDSGMRYFESEDTILTVSGTASYALPDDHWNTIGVDYLESVDGRRSSLSELMVQERNTYSGTSGDCARSYAIVGANLVLYPTPGNARTYFHVYVPQPADLTAAADALEVDVITPYGEAFIIEHMAVKALAKEESDITLAMAERERYRELIIADCAERSMTTPRRNIVDDNYSPRIPGGYRWSGDLW